MFDHQQYNHQYYQDNKERLKAAAVAYHYDNLDQVKVKAARYYQDHKEEFKARTAKRWAEGEPLRRFVNDYKSRPCADCNQVFHPVAMDFDHVRGEKSGNIATMVGGMKPFIKIWAEIEKCVVVCANCHRVRSFVKGEAI